MKIGNRRVLIDRVEMPLYNEEFVPLKIRLGNESSSGCILCGIRDKDQSPLLFVTNDATAAAALLTRCTRLS